MSSNPNSSSTCKSPSCVTISTNEAVMGKPHVLVIPCPAQGHVMPLMELSHWLVDRGGFKVTFVNSDRNHKRLVAAMPHNGADHDYEGQIRLVSIPDGMPPEGNQNDFLKLADVVRKVMGTHLEDLIKKINNESNSEEDKIKFIIADVTIGWALEVAEKMKIRRAAFWPAYGATLASTLHIPKMIEDGIINENGFPTKSQMVQLSPEMPTMNTNQLVWIGMGDEATQQSIFNLMVRNNHALKLADYFLCNSFYDLEPSVFKLIPNLRPIGPLLTSSRFGHFWPEDSTCLKWLDTQPHKSVIYVAFGSSTFLDKIQMDELALGLELSWKRFLWVVRPDLVNGPAVVLPDGFEARVASRGRVVGWAPQKEVLGHPSVACFFTHCGWNSTMEGLSMGVPFLCWPYFGDQILNKSYICDVWRVGLGFDPEENGVILQQEIKKKVEALLGDERIRENALKLKEMALSCISEGGSSLKNFDDFVEEMRS